MSIQPITAQSSLLQVMSQMQASAGIEPTTIAPSSIQGESKVDFFKIMEQAVKSVDAQQHDAAQRVADVETGRSDDLVGAMVASQKASLTFSAAVQVRNKLLSGLEETMRMPV